MWFLGFLIGFIVILVCLLHALVTVTNCCDDEDDYWMGW